MIAIQALINRMLTSRNKELRQLAKESEEALEKVHQHLLDNDKEIARLRRIIVDASNKLTIAVVAATPEKPEDILPWYRTITGAIVEVDKMFAAALEENHENQNETE